MDSAHRRELKHDKFIDKVGQGVEYADEHRRQVITWGGAAAVLVLAGLGGYWYVGHQHTVRQAALHQAMETFEAGIGAGGGEFIKSFPTQEEKDKAVVKQMTDLVNSYGGKEEGQIAQYFLGLYYADKGNLAEAEKNLKPVADSGKDPYASQAKLSLAQVYDSQGRVDDAEKVLRSVISSPTILVSKEQATISLAKILAKKKPAEARKLLEPLRSERGPVSRAAITALSDIPAQ